MKKLLFTLVVVCGLQVSVNAQDEIQQIQDAWGKEKKELVRIAMALERTDSLKFWPLYNVYEKERQKLGRERILILANYADNYSTITNAKADELVNRIFKNDAALAKLQQLYYTKVKTAINAIQATKFLHVENYINSTIRSEVQGNLPMIQQIDSLKSL